MCSDKEKKLMKELAKISKKTKIIKKVKVK